jgi:hypothetical protein
MDQVARNRLCESDGVEWLDIMRRGAASTRDALFRYPISCLSRTHTRPYRQERALHGSRSPSYTTEATTAASLFLLESGPIKVCVGANV